MKKDNLPDFGTTLFRTFKNCNGNTNQRKFQSISNQNGSSSTNPALPTAVILRFSATSHYCSTADRQRNITHSATPRTADIKIQKLNYTILSGTPTEHVKKYTYR